MPFEIVRQEITKMPVNCIVNAANSRLAEGGGVCGAIFSAAGHRELQRACDAIGYCKTGDAVITDGFALAAKYIIHTVGPIWCGGKRGEEEQLRSCYKKSLALAAENGCMSIAFPLISAGIYGYPPYQALRVAVDTITEYLNEHEDMLVYLTIFGNIHTVEAEEVGDIQRYINTHRVALPKESGIYPSAKNVAFVPAFDACGFDDMQAAEYDAMPECLCESMSTVGSFGGFVSDSLTDMLDKLDESFSCALLRTIDAKGMTDVEVYKRANIDRKLFSKIRKGEGYNPSKPTALALAIALRLDLEETQNLLSKAGYTLSRSSKFDLIIEYFIVHKKYDIHEINCALFEFDQRLLGA